MGKSQFGHLNCPFGLSSSTVIGPRIRAFGRVVHTCSSLSRRSNKVLRLVVLPSPAGFVPPLPTHMIVNSGVKAHKVRAVSTSIHLFTSPPLSQVLEATGTAEVPFLKFTFGIWFLRNRVSGPLVLW
jgi:hypothetical protein